MKPALVLAAFVTTTCLAAPITLAGAGEERCHPLLMPPECKAFQEKTRHARTSRERATLKDSYAQLLREREQACGCGKTSSLWPYSEQIRDLPRFISNSYM
jgi:hypothetical protein